MRLSITSKQVLRWLTPLVMLNQFLFFMGINTRLLFGFLLVGVILGFSSRKGNSGNSFAKFVLGFIFYSLASGILFLFHEVPFVSYVIEVDKYLCAMAFFFIGSDRNNTGDDYEKFFLWSCLVCFLVGFYLYFAPPPWYSRRLVAMRALRWYKSIASEFTIVDYSRFSSFWGNSYAMSFFGVTALGFSFLEVDIGSTKRNRLLGWLGVFVCWMACILSQQRIAMACSTLTVGVHLLYTGVVERKQYALWLAAGAGAAILALVSLDPDNLGHRFSVVSEQLQQRAEDLSFGTAMSTRTQQYENALKNWDSVWVGYGVGSASGYARSQQLMGVNDGNYVKILYEQGLIGVAWFALILLGSLIWGTRHFRYCRFETGILMFFLLAGIGSNAFCLNGLYVMPFWYALGRIWNPEELARRKALVRENGGGAAVRRGAARAGWTPVRWRFHSWRQGMPSQGALRAFPPIHSGNGTS